MGRFKRTRDWPDKLEKMSEAELRRELAYWQNKARILGQKGSHKTALDIEKILDRRFPARDD
jgi:hypothetical protein